MGSSFLPGSQLAAVGGGRLSKRFLSVLFFFCKERVREESFVRSRRTAGRL